MSVRMYACMYVCLLGRFAGIINYNLNTFVPLPFWLKPLFPVQRMNALFRSKHVFEVPPPLPPITTTMSNFIVFQRAGGT